MNESAKKKLNQAATDSARKVTDAAAAQAGLMREAAAQQAKLVASDIFTAIRTDRRAQLLCLILILAVVCWEMPGISAALYPLKLFETIVHEACHAFMTRLTGGQVVAIALDPSKSGVTMSGGGIEFLVSCAGYMGSATFGGLLIWWGRKPGNARLVLHTIGIVVLALTAFYVGGGWFSVTMSALIGATLFFIARKCSDKFCHIFLLLLAVITTLEGLLSIQELIYLSAATKVHSDAFAMEKLTGIPSIVWSCLWGFYSLFVLTTSFWLSYRPARTESAAANSTTQSGANSSVNLATSLTTLSADDLAAADEQGVKVPSDLVEESGDPG